MRMIKIFTSIGLALTCFSCLGQSLTEFQFRMPERFADPGSVITLTIDSAEFNSTIGPDSIARFRIPKFHDTRQVQVTYSKNGFGSETWKNGVNFIGSDTVLLSLRRRAGGQSFIYMLEVMQYPLIQFESAQSVHEVSIDGDVIGNTSTSHTVKPMVNHVLIWKKGNTKVCEKVVYLGYNQAKKYKCNDNGEIVED